MKSNYDFPARIAEAIYKKSDKANAPENQTEGFHAGFRVGTGYAGGGLDRIEFEFRFNRKPEPEWEEWKRGFWAGKMQKTWAKVTSDRP